MRSRSGWLIAFVAWTVFVWAGRVRNAGADPGAWLVAGAFIVLAVAALASGGRVRRAVLGVLVAATVALWALRTPLVWIRDYSVAFKVVHTVIAVISVGLAVVAQRHVERQGQASAPTSGLQELADR